ncbi:MAG: 5'-methylthioadenosine/S-adenosylhomocysteine nucleosidase, partial [Candidatus Dormibacteraeota bacterium]|nr:5'-methylthioadenosine/S-adenosylhomocysteine nucleosidase [Candidatus Dormibacteraeota bacterium]
PSTVTSPQLSIWEGVVDGTPVVLVITGVGKVAAALAAQFTWDAFRPRCVIAVGLAGATQSDAPRGQLIIASGALQHDVDARPLTAEQGTIPSLGIAEFPADTTLSEKLFRSTVSVVADRAVVRSGLVLTGDQIVTSRELRERILSEFPEGSCFDMETAAIAQVAHMNRVPWAALRMTSDAADETFNLEDVLGFGINTAADLFDHIVREVLKDV